MFFVLIKISRIILGGMSVFDITSIVSYLKIIVVKDKAINFHETSMAFTDLKNFLAHFCFRKVLDVNKVCFPFQ